MSGTASHDGVPKPDGLSIACKSGNGTIKLRRATEDDFDWMIALRNQTSVRQWFFDPRIIDSAVGRTWLEARANSMHDTVLIICHKATASRLGTIGWICVNSDKRIFEAGRLALDAAILRKLCKSGVSREILSRVAIDAGLALRDYVFEVLGANILRTEHKPNNKLSAKLIAEAGLRPVSVGCDGRVLCQLSRESWRNLSQAVGNP